MNMNRLAFDCEVKLAADGGETGTIEGYASVYNVVDRGGDIVLPGAFRKSLAEWRKRKAMPPMLWQHDSWTPIGLWTEIDEDHKGLKVKGDLVLEVPAAVTAHALARAKVVKGLSIGYATKQATFDRQTGIRSIKEAELIEVSLVTFPMNQDATISGVKGDFDPRVMERALRDEGLSDREAKIAVSVFKKSCRDGGTGGTAPRDGETDLILSLRKCAEALR
ncbi:MULTISPECIES: HK97 family phage prohead protease [Sphingomonadales]|uniref:HK97 family phage prohead protease n=1 Tax=Sphingomonadales TaxID=204457 RepID=UPI000826C18E|nr:MULTISPECIES: HK97 family phage prohead protease [Sphingomonadales]